VRYEGEGTLIAQREEAIEGFFPATAMPDADWWEALWPEPKQVLATLGIRADMEVIDLCCGDGLFTAPLALMSQRVVGIDIDPNMLAATRAKMTASGATNYELIEGDAYDVVQLVHGPVDFVLMAKHLPRRARQAAFLARRRCGLEAGRALCRC
jgi:ubiquinone/menaquinone biosynthesis C-methylase UbiE